VPFPLHGSPRACFSQIEEIGQRPILNLTGAEKMKVMCLNGWGGKLHETLVRYVHSECPDVLCLQEVVHSPETEQDRLTYRDGDHVLPQRANFFRDVSLALLEHVAIFCPAAQGVLWDGDASIPSQWGLATFVHKSLPVVAQAQGFVHKSFSPHGYGDHPRSRSAHAVRVYDYGRDRPVSIAHMHGLRDPRGKMDTPERADQARRLLDLSDRVSEPGDLRVICGDFNVEPNSETLEILKQIGFTELVTTFGFEGTRSSQYRKPGRFADYMLVNRCNDVAGFNVIYEPEISDHCPLILDL
jgi:endonuclease/exonuclease/phosphatase family metal-dependent hydrolase